MQKNIKQALFVILLFLHGCGLFDSREVEPPTESRSTFIQPTSPDLVLTNLIFSISEKNLDNYMRCFVDSNFSNKRFRYFPDAVSKAMKESENSLRDKTIVSFCTGGIRCEKAALYLQEKGHPKVLQLDGGILRYFEDVGGAHWQGECFVFDERVSLDPALKASGKTLADRREKKGKN